MRKFLVIAVGMLMFLTAHAAPTCNVGQQQTDQVLLMQQTDQVLLMQQTDGSKMVVDFVYSDYPVMTIATMTKTEYTIYQADFADVRTQVFDLTMPVFRLCSHRANAFKYNIYTGWRGVNSNTHSQYDRA